MKAFALRDKGMALISWIKALNPSIYDHINTVNWFKI
jgi:hypothetical protein